MKRCVTRFDEFLVWKFYMDKGDIKTFTREEITRGLTTYGDMTMNSISVFVKGSFVTHRDGMPPLYSVPGMGGARWVEAKSLEGFAIEALEDGSEYHCVTPFEKAPRFWNRAVYRFERANQRIGVTADSYVYVALGSVIVSKTTIVGPQLARVSKSVDIIGTDQFSILATMSPHEPQV